MVLEPFLRKNGNRSPSDKRNGRPDWTGNTVQMNVMAVKVSLGIELRPGISIY